MIDGHIVLHGNTNDFDADGMFGWVELWDCHIYVYGIGHHVVAHAGHKIHLGGHWPSLGYNLQKHNAKKNGKFNKTMATEVKSIQYAPLQCHQAQPS